MNGHRTTLSWPVRPGLTLYGLITLGAVVDLGCKALAREWLTPHVPVALLPGVNLTLGFNSGVVFGVIPADSALALTAMLFVQTGLIAILIVLYSRASLAEQYCYASILAGALGNLADRLTSARVTDYIDLYAGTWHWPTFNVADIFISLGVVGLISHGLISGRYRTILE